MKKFDIGLGSITLLVEGFTVRIYKPCRISGRDDQVLFKNHTDGNEYSFYESELLAAREETNKLTVDITFNNKSYNQEYFEYISGVRTFTTENMMDGSFVVGADRIGEVINDLYNNLQLFKDGMKSVRIAVVMEKFGIDEEQYNEIEQHFTDIQGVHEE